MASQPKLIKVNRDTTLEDVAREATDAPVVFELDGRVFEMTPRGSSSAFTVENAYASVRTADGRTGAEISAEEFNQMMQDAKEDYADYLTRRYVEGQ